MAKKKENKKVSKETTEKVDKDETALAIEYVGIDKITQYSKNTRRHSQESIEVIKKSIEDFGMNDPIAVWGKGNTIVEGHGRYRACIQLGIKEVPVIHLDHLTEKQRKAYGIAHNKTAEVSDWDLDMLHLEIQNVEDEFDVKNYGFKLTLNEDTEELKKLKEDEQKKKKMVVCPKCGHEFDPKKSR